MKSCCSLLVVWVDFQLCCFLISIIRIHGADLSPKSCETMLPSENSASAVAQNGTPPYSIQLTETSSAWVITLRSTNVSIKFKEFFIQVRQPGGNNAEGIFDDEAADVAGGTAQTMDCFGIAKNGVSHASDDDKTSVTVHWNPLNIGEYQIYYTVFKDSSTFWALVSHPQKIQITKNPINSQNALLDKWRAMYKNCGDGQTKGCFGLPENCVQDFDAKSKRPKTCDIMVTWSETANGHEFELTGRPTGSGGEGNVAFGLSDDIYMGEDSVVGCTLQRGDQMPVIQRYFNLKGQLNNVKHSNANLGFKAISSSSIAGILFCKFTQTDHNINGFSVNFKTKYYFMLSRGPYDSGKGLGKHPTSHDRGVSGDPVFVTDYSMVDTLINSLLPVQIHGALMLFAWCVFSSSGMFTTRYYRQSCMGKTFLGRPFWLTVHVTCMLANAILTVTAAGLIVYQKGGMYFTFLHNIFGLCVIALGIPQGILPLFRNSSCAPNLQVFRWVHFVVGLLIQIAAYTSIVLALNLDLANLVESNRLWIGGFVALIIFQFTMYATMTYHTFWTDRKLEVEQEYRNRALTLGPMGPNGMFTEAPGKTFRFLMLAVYICGATFLSTLLTCVVFHAI